MFIIISSKIQILKRNQIDKIKIQLIISHNNIIKSSNKKTHIHKIKNQNAQYLYKKVMDANPQSEIKDLEWRLY